MEGKMSQKPINWPIAQTVRAADPYQPTKSKNTAHQKCTPTIKKAPIFL